MAVFVGAFVPHGRYLAGRKPHGSVFGSARQTTSQFSTCLVTSSASAGREDQSDQSAQAAMSASPMCPRQAFLQRPSALGICRCSLPRTRRCLGQPLFVYGFVPVAPAEAVGPRTGHSCLRSRWKVAGPSSWCIFLKCMASTQGRPTSFRPSCLHEHGGLNGQPTRSQLALSCHQS